MRASPNDNTGNKGRRILPGRRSPGRAPRLKRPANNCPSYLSVRCCSERVRKTLEENFEQLSSPQRFLLAGQLGYESFDKLLDASTVVTLSDGSVWWLTADQFGAWTAWNLYAIGFPQDGQTSDATVASRGNGR